MTTTSDTISGYFDRIGWWYKVLDNGKVLTTYRCQVTAYHYVIAIEVSASQHWVTVRALLQSDVGGAHLDSVLRLISRWNEVSHQARFLLVSDSVVVQAEIPALRLTAELFLEALSAVCHYSTLAGAEIAAIATNPSLCALFDSVIASTALPAWEGTVPDEILNLDFDISMNRIPDLSKIRQASLRA